MQVSIVMPVYNEENALSKMIPICTEVMNSSGLTYEIIICDNASTDSSVEIARKYEVKIVEEERKGYGYALKKAIGQAKGDIIVTLDADDTYPLEDIPRLYKEIVNKKLGLLVANRFSQSYVLLDSMPIINRMGNMFLSAMVRVLFSVDMIDSQTGMVLFPQEYRKVADEKPYDDFSYSQSLKLLIIKKYGASFEEVRIQYTRRIGKKKLKVVSDGWKNFIALLQLKKALEL